MKTLKRIWIGSQSFTFVDENNVETTVRAENFNEASLKYKLHCDSNYKDYDWE